MLKEWVMEHPEEAAEVCRGRVLSAQRLPDPVQHVKVLSVHLPPDLQHPTTHLPGQLTGGIPNPMIAVITERQAPSKGMLLQGKRPLIDQGAVALQDLTLLMKEKELRILKTIAETGILTTTETVETGILTIAIEM